MRTLGSILRLSSVLPFLDRPPSPKRMSGAMRRSLHPTARFPGEKSWPTPHTMKHHECIVRICQNHSLHISQKLSFNSTFRSLKELVKSWFTLSDFPSRCWGGGSGSRGALDQEAKSVKAGVKDNNHPGKNGAVHVITCCTRSRWTIDICRLLHGRVFVEVFGDMATCTASMQCISSCSPGQLLKSFSCPWSSLAFLLQHFWYASMPDAQVQVALAWALFAVLWLSWRKSSSERFVGVETIGASDVGTCR